MKTLKVTLTRRLANGPQSILERALIAEFLLAKGYLLSDLENLPEQEAKDLMKAACLYAGLRLAEIEAKAKFRRTISWPGI
ncbi:MAG: hypothetical protein ACK2UW_04600 [Anaerolineales bacterium]|jgi:hypothetical protein